jgi:16S rRNA (adenine1518-N6/adenine1519-N6)-dimethyltransferase
MTPSPSATGRRPSPHHRPDNRLFQEARQLRLKKRFSQNFLVNESVLRAIAERLHLSADEPVLEIGAGSGFLTEALLKTGATVTAVELDRAMCYYLRKKFANKPNFHLIEDDILRVNLEMLDAALKNSAAQIKIVGNLPYQITSKILFHLAGELHQADYPLRDRIRQLTVMVQKEVAERITASPGQRAYNPLSIALQLRFEAQLDVLVPARDFYPAPKVDSAVVTLTPRTEPLVEIHDLTLFSKLIRIAFAQKRKTVRNALLNGSFASATVLDRIFEATGVDSGLRAEALSIVTFGELSNAFGANAGQD